MKKVWLLIFVLACFRMNLANENEEFRSIWVITWEYLESGRTVGQNQRATREILDNLQKANMNAVLWQVRQSGTAYYPSSFEPWGYYTGGRNPGYDPLAYAIEEAHKRGIEVHAWFNCFESGSTTQGTPANMHPEWICRDGNGNPMISKIALSPGLAEVRAYLINVAMEIVRNYDIDGLHLDYVRWNDEHSSDNQQNLSLKKIVMSEKPIDGIMSDEEIEVLQSVPLSSRYLYDVEHPYSAGIPAGFSSWEDWWRWSVTEFVRVLHDSIQAVKPWIRLSPAALGNYRWGGWQGYGTVYQDVALWFNEGFIDQLTPMHYHWTTAPDFYAMLVSNGTESWQYYIKPGIQAGRLFSVGPGSSMLAEKKVWENHPAIVKRCRQIPWVDGFQFFSYGTWKNHDYFESAGDLFFQRKTKVRATKLINNQLPEPPTVLLSKINSLTYSLSVTPPISITSNHWFALYRSEDTIFDVNEDQIINIHFGNDKYHYEEKFSGLQDFNQHYSYFATTLDRFWNESAISNVVQTDRIPSYAPVISSTYPIEGDTISVNENIRLQFSKTMNPTSFNAAFTFFPPASISQLNWSSDYKTLTLEIAGTFDFAQKYNLTIDPKVIDVNSQQLDGNNDGIAGDPYILHFFTREKDLIGPKVIMSYPDSNFVGFDPDEIITFVFDEAIDPNSIQDSSIIFKVGDEFISFSHSLVNIEDYSILSIQPKDRLIPNALYSTRLNQTIADTFGNRIQNLIEISFQTSNIEYKEVKDIDKFWSTSNWWQPEGSGSTVGTYVPNTKFEMSSKVFQPAMPRPQQKSACLKYQWDSKAASYLIREYLFADAPRAILFDKNYILQCYIFGDGSHNKFRFCVDDSTKDQAAFHEVSQWLTIDWYGWRLVEWQLDDPTTVGEWLGDGKLHGPSFRFDSFQLSHDPGASLSGTIFFDDLRIVKKLISTVGIPLIVKEIPEQFVLFQNFPNPFNPTTKICFELPQSGKVQLAIYDLLGREVARIYDEVLAAGVHQVNFDATHLPSGTYFYRLQFGHEKLIRSMILIK